LKNKFYSRAEEKKDSPALISYLGELDAHIEKKLQKHCGLVQVEALSVEINNYLNQ